MIKVDFMKTYVLSLCLQEQSHYPTVIALLFKD